MRKLLYNGTAYNLSEEAAADLIAHGVIAQPEPGSDYLELAPEHVIDEVEAVTTAVERRDAPAPPQIDVPKAPWWDRLPR